MNTTKELEKEISAIEGHYFQGAKKIRDFLFNDNYDGLNKYLNRCSDSLKSDLDLLRNKVKDLSSLEDNSTHTAVQLSLPFK